MLKREKAFEQFLTIAAKAIFSLVLDIRWTDQDYLSI
jgi:hypothetical protein